MDLTSAGQSPILGDSRTEESPPLGGAEEMFLSFAEGKGLYRMGLMSMMQVIR